MTKQERNKLIYEQYSKGYSQATIGEFHGLSQSAVSLIIISQRDGQKKGDQEQRGAKSRLTNADQERLVELLELKQAESGFSGWNKRSVKALINEEFGVDYHTNYIWEIMRKIGYTSQLPAMKDYRQDPQKVEQFKEQKAPAIKKSRARGA